MIDCPICGDKIPRNDLEIESHLLYHEDEWVKMKYIPQSFI